MGIRQEYKRGEKMEENKDDNWTDEQQKQYDLNLRMFCKGFQDSMKASGNHNFGFIFLFVRHPEAECIDIANNMGKEDCIISLKEAVRMLEASEPSQSRDYQSKTHTPSPEGSEADLTKAEEEPLH